jgi:membrane protease YdiL (CAAX protease family)
MNVTYNMLFTQVKPQSLIGKFIHFPIVRIFIVAVFIAPFLLLHNTVLMDAILTTAEPLLSALRYLDAVITILIVLLLYSLYTKHVEKRKAHEISLKSSFREFGAGLLIALCLVGFMVVLMAILGFYRIESTESAKIIFDSFFLFGVGAFIQEFGFRLILFRLLDELLGSWITFVIVALIFGIAHLGNPNATALTTASLILGDVMLAAAYLYTRRLWLVWGIHFGWNFFQDGIFGMPNSGITDFASWIQPQITGPVWLTGGNFGIEASTVALFLTLLVGVFILRLVIKNKQIAPPVWSR